MVTGAPGRLADGARRGARRLVREAKKPIRAAWRRRVLDGGTDDTEASARRRTLVVAPHPDDETIGCGAAIARKRAAGTRVDVVVVCDGRHSHRSAVITPQQLADQRASESVKACEVLGVEACRVRFLGFEEQTLWRCLDEVAATLATCIAEVDPEEILVVTDQDWHTDHQATHVALLRAVARGGFDGRVGAYPVWFWADGPWRNVPVGPLGESWRELLAGPWAARRLPRADLVRTGEHAARKRDAFACYTSQTTNLSGEDGWATFAAGWIDPFLQPAEVFFPVDAAAVQRSLTDRRQQPVGDGGPIGPASAEVPRAESLPAPAVGERLVDSTSDLLVDASWPPGGVTDDSEHGLLERTVALREPPALVQATFETAARYAPHGRCGLLVRLDDDGSGWRVVVRADVVELARRERWGGDWQVVASVRDGAHAAQRLTLAVYDDTRRLHVRLGGRDLFPAGVAAPQQRPARRVGVLHDGAAILIAFSADAHPHPTAH